MECGDAASWIPPIDRHLRLRSRNLKMDAVRPHGIPSGEKQRGCVVRAKVRRQQWAHPWLRELPRVAIFGTSSCWGHDLLPIAADKVIDGGSTLILCVIDGATDCVYNRFGCWVFAVKNRGKIITARHEYAEPVVRVGGLLERKRQGNIWQPVVSRFGYNRLHSAAALRATACPFDVLPTGFDALLDHIILFERGYGILIMTYMPFPYTS